jgi:hypothetical protein
MKTFLKLALAAIVLDIVPGAASATENGLQHYPIGVNTTANALLPLPGMLEFEDYNVAEWGDQLMGNNGRPLPLSFQLHAQVDAMRFLYTWKSIQIGPFYYTTGFVPPIVHSNVSIGDEHGDATNVGDMDIQNYLYYAGPTHKLFYYFGWETYIPTGRYNQNNLVNIGNNYWTFAPNLDITYIPSPQLELTATILTEFNTTNPATDYHSGSDIDFDWGTTWRPFLSVPKLGFGVQGYFYKQYQNDTQLGQVVQPGGNKGQEFGIGPQIRYDIPYGGFVVKYQHTYALRNRPSDDRVWFEVAFPLSGTQPG